MPQIFTMSVLWVKAKLESWRNANLSEMLFSSDFNALCFSGFLHPNWKVGETPA
jgi:hypothetical protein